MATPSPPQSPSISSSTTFSEIIRRIKEEVEVRFSQLFRQLEERRHAIIQQLDDILHANEKSISELQKKVSVINRAKQAFNEVISEETDNLMMYVRQEVDSRLKDLMTEVKEQPQVSFFLDSSFLYQLKYVGKIEIISCTPILPQKILPPNGTSYGATFKPWACDSDTAGNLYILSLEVDPCVKILDPQGHLKDVVSHQRPTRPMTFSDLKISDTYIFVSVFSEHRIEVYEKGCGKFYKYLGYFGSREGQFQTPLGLCVYLNHLMVADCHNSRVQVFTPDLKFSHMIGSGGNKPGKVRLPSAVAIGPKDEILVCHNGNPCVNAYNFSGDLLYQFGSCLLGQEMIQPIRMCTLPSGTVLISDSAQHKIIVYQCDMIRMKRVGQEGDGIGEFKRPVGLHYMSSTNQLLVCDSENKRIQVFNPEEF